MDIARLIEQRPLADIVACSRATPLHEAVARLAANRIGALPVIEGERVVGILSERDVVRRLAEDGPACLDYAVGEIMTADPIVVDSRTSVLDALALMTERRIRHLPVLDGGALRGFVSIGDLVKSRLEEIEYEADAMRIYIQSA